MTAPLTPGRLSEIRADMRTILYISDGTSGSDKVARLLSVIPPLLAEVDRLTAALDVAEKGIRNAPHGKGCLIPGRRDWKPLPPCMCWKADYDAAREGQK